MSSIQQTSSQTVSSATTSVTAKKAAENPQDRFLKLLVTQMKNQDPLKPLDNAEVTSQLAQISTVTGIDKLNNTLQILNSDVEDSLSVEATNMIGHNAFVSGNIIELKEGSAKVGFELEQPVDQLTVTIKDSAGLVVREIDLKAYSEGISSISWDGKTNSGSTAPEGTYTFEVTAEQGGDNIKVTPLALGSVKSVSTGDDGTLLDMGKLGLINLSNVKQVF